MNPTYKLLHREPIISLIILLNILKIKTVHTIEQRTISSYSA